jgi:hypothetical protein
VVDELDDLPEEAVVVPSAEIFDTTVERELSFFLAWAVVKCGGALVLTSEELRAHVMLTFDEKFYAETGGVRMLAFEGEDKSA